MNYPSAKGSPHRKAVWDALTTKPTCRANILHHVNHILWSKKIKHISDRDFRELVRAMRQDGIPILTTLNGYCKCFKPLAYKQSSWMHKSYIRGHQKDINCNRKIAEKLSGQRRLNFRTAAKLV